MSIGFVAPELYPDKIGGAEIFNYYYLKKVKMFTNIVLFTHSDFQDNKIKVVKIKKRISFLDMITYYYSIYKIRNKLVLLHLSFMEGPRWIYWQIFPIIKYLLKIPYIITIHGHKTHKYKHEKFYKLFFTNAYQVIGVSDNVLDKYKEQYNISKTRVIPSDIPLLKNHKYENIIKNMIEYRPSLKIFSIVGTIKLLKNPFCILKAIKELGNNYCERHNLLFVFAGDGPLKERCIDFVDSNNLNKFVKFLGIVSRYKMPSLYHLSFGYIIASKIESNSISTLEAIYNDLIVLAADVEALNKIYDDNEILFFRYDDHKNLAGKIRQICENELEAKDMIQRTKNRYSNRFVYDKNVIQPYLEIYNHNIKKQGKIAKCVV